MFLSDLMAIEPPVVIYQKDGKAYYGNGQKTESFQLKPSAKATTTEIKPSKIGFFNLPIDKYIVICYTMYVKKSRGNDNGKSK